ncbi:MAG: hypothetical protein ACI83I_002666 [Bacteroidia bacterium]|jgi:hypothetical protein
MVFREVPNVLLTARLLLLWSSNRRIFLSLFIVTILFAILKLFYHSKHGTKSARLVAPFQPEQVAPFTPE